MFGTLQIRRRTEFIYLAPIYVNGTVFIIDKYDITCLNATNADTVWSFFTGDELYIAPTYANGLIYDVTSERHIFILNASNKGTELDKVTTPSSSWSSPTIANGELYIGCNDWNLYCYTSAVPGQVISTSPSTSPGAPSGINGTYLTAAIVVIALILIVGVVAVALISMQRPKKPAAPSP